MEKQEQNKVFKYESTAKKIFFEKSEREISEGFTEALDGCNSRFITQGFMERFICSTDKITAATEEETKEYYKQKAESRFYKSFLERK